MRPWDDRLMALAHHVASWSKDPSTKVGAVLHGRDRRDIALGYNGFPPGIRDTHERLNDRNLKLIYTQHAERNVLDNARFDPRGGILYVTFFPCVECAKSIVSKGVVQVFTYPPSLREPWATQARWTKELFNEAGIELVIADG